MQADQGLCCSHMPGHVFAWRGPDNNEVKEVSQSHIAVSVDTERKSEQTGTSTAFDPGLTVDHSFNSV